MLNAKHIFNTYLKPVILVILWILFIGWVYLSLGEMMILSYKGWEHDRKMYECQKAYQKWVRLGRPSSEFFSNYSSIFDIFEEKERQSPEDKKRLENLLSFALWLDRNHFEPAPYVYCVNGRVFKGLFQISVSWGGRYVVCQDGTILSVFLPKISVLPPPKKRYVSEYQTNAPSKVARKRNKIEHSQ